MAGTSFFALIDDIISILDDVAVLSKIATKKTVGIIGDDLALNAKQVVGIRAEREIPVIWAVAKGSLVNKAILVPVALLISYVAPFLIQPLLMVGGAYLCFEGAEKILHSLSHRQASEELEDKFEELLETDNQAEINTSASTIIENSLQADQDFRKEENLKIKGAIRTDFILSAEIVVIALGSFADANFMLRTVALSLVAIAITILVYAVVACIVKLDDLGLWLIEKPKVYQQKLGASILAFAPKFMKLLTIVGMAAMFLVGGGIIMHGLPFMHHAVEIIEHALTQPIIKSIGVMAFEGIFGFVAGLLVIGLHKTYTQIKAKF